jgi:hypothetical protein
MHRADEPERIKRRQHADSREDEINRVRAGADEEIDVFGAVVDSVEAP